MRRIEGDAGPSAADESAVGVGEAVGGADDAVLDGRALPVAGGVERRQHVARQLAGFFDDGGGKLLVDFLAARQGRYTAEKAEVIQCEGDVAERRRVCGHSIFPGFRMPLGSRAALIERMRSRSSAGL